MVQNPGMNYAWPAVTFVFTMFPKFISTSADSRYPPCISVGRPRRFVDSYKRSLSNSKFLGRKCLGRRRCGVRISTLRPITLCVQPAELFWAAGTLSTRAGENKDGEDQHGDPAVHDLQRAIPRAFPFSR